MENRIRELRARERITQDELAHEVGVTRQTIIAIENGKYDPSLSLAFRIAKRFMVRIEELFQFRSE